MLTLSELLLHQDGAPQSESNRQKKRHAAVIVQLQDNPHACEPSSTHPERTQSGTAGTCCTACSVHHDRNLECLDSFASSASS